MLKLIYPVPSDQIEQCYKLRYQAYCIDNPFEPQNDLGLETDEYDNKSVHILITENDEPVGCTRIIPSDFGGVGEISRFCVLSKTSSRLKAKCLLIDGIVKAANDNGIHTLFSVMEPRFRNALARIGRNFIPIGPLFQYRGKRQAYYIQVPPQ